MYSTFSFAKNTVGFILEGEITKKDFNKICSALKSRLKEHDKINIYLENNNIDHYTIPAVFKEIAFKLKYGEHFDKVAIVTNRKWIKALAVLENVISAAHIKNFSIEDRLEAMNWVTEK